ncbi:MAG: hypothetical protein IT305_25100 [Chloroflexi bacterium]|nr:hypothetical protein [Chloroflexota bacterium]
MMSQTSAKAGAPLSSFLLWITLHAAIAALLSLPPLGSGDGWPVLLFFGPLAYALQVSLLPRRPTDSVVWRWLPWVLAGLIVLSVSVVVTPFMAGQAFAFCQGPSVGCEVALFPLVLLPSGLALGVGEWAISRRTPGALWILAAQVAGMLLFGLLYGLLLGAGAGVLERRTGLTGVGAAIASVPAALVYAYVVGFALLRDRST